jgi:hypothetical protein
MFGAFIRAAERCKSIKVTEFERRQLSVVSIVRAVETSREEVGRIFTFVPRRFVVGRTP